MRGVVRLEALRALAAEIDASVPDLKSKTEIHQVPPDYKAGWPRVAVIAGGAMRYEPRQEYVKTRVSDSAIVVNVGSWITTAQIRLGCATPAERFALEEKLTEMFWRVENQPGLLLTTVTACPHLGDILASWDIGDTDWADEFAFSSQYWTVLSLDAVIPALVTREGVYSLNELRLGVTDDFSLPETSAAFDTLTQKVTVNQDGTVTPI